MPSPADCQFTDSHEWFRVDGDVVTIGITEFAASELGELVYIELPGEGEDVQFDQCILPDWSN